jgi:hypothetical protein
MDGAEIKKLVGQWILLLSLGKYPLQSEGQFAQPRSFRPGLIVRLATQVLKAAEQPVAAMGAHFKAGYELLTEDTGQHLQLIGFHFVARVHFSPFKKNRPSFLSGESREGALT